MIGYFLGALGGLFHRFYLSPFIGRQKASTQSVGTPAAGVMVAFFGIMLALRPDLKRLVNDPKVRHDVERAMADRYKQVYFMYGLVVVLTILADVGGVKKS